MNADERRRVPKSFPTLGRELQLLAQGYVHVAGVDEAGRGPLAGPVVAGAVMLPNGFTSPHFHVLNDSKQLDAKTRAILFDELSHGARCGIGVANNWEIDEINIRQATWLAMQRAISTLSEMFGAPDFVLLDGLPFGPAPFAYEAIVKGDAKSLSIAAASIIAKVHRDQLMIALDTQFPGYGFAQHKGYGTPQHLNALRNLGPCPIHRRSFAPVRNASK